MERGEQGLTLIGVASALHEANVCQLEGKQAGGHEPRAIELGRHKIGLRFAEQQRGKGGGVDDLSVRHGLRGSDRRPR